MRQNRRAARATLAAVCLCASARGYAARIGQRASKARARGAEASVNVELERYPWRRLDEIMREFRILEKRSLANRRRLADLQARYADTRELQALIAKREDLLSELKSGFEEIREVKLRFRAVQKKIQLQAFARGLRKGIGKDNKKTAGAFIAKYVAYTQLFGETNHFTARHDQFIKDDAEQFKLVQATLVRQEEMEARLTVAAGAALVLGLSAAILFALKKPPPPTLSALPYEAIPRLPAEFQSPAAKALPAPEPPPGAPQVIGGNFRIEREIARGGMGIVYQAKDLSLGREVAVKKMRGEFIDKPEDREKFLGEARLVARLKHPNLVEIYSIVEEAGRLYLVFEYIRGWTLYKFLDRKDRMPLKQSRFVLRQTAGALDYAHSKRVIHRDLKPSNIMISSDGRIKVMDFGIAHQAKSTVARLTRAEAWGTPPYMAPEQEKGIVSRESDLFALGVCFYEMITGELPFRGPNYYAQKREMIFTPPSKVNPELPKALDAVIGKALATEPPRRFHSGAEFAKAVAAAAGKA